MPVSTIPGAGITTSTTLTTPIVATTMGVGGATPSTSGSGITFPATQSASTDVNTLDDYEEGTWTPVLTRFTTAPTISYSTQSGTYVKIGQMVYCMAEINVSSVSANGSGLNQISGFPFPTENSGVGGGSRWAGILSLNAALTAADAFYLLGSNNTSGFFFNLTNQTNPNANYSAGSFFATFVYKASA